MRGNSAKPVWFPFQKVDYKRKEYASLGKHFVFRIKKRGFSTKKEIDVQEKQKGSFKSCLSFINSGKFTKCIHSSFLLFNVL